MEIIGALLVSTIAGLSTTLGSFLIFLKIKEKNINKFITVSLSFSLAIMIAISITDLIPESLTYLLLAIGIKKGLLYALISFILGIFLIKYLNKLIKKQENKADLYKLGILNMLALILHNFPEGIATFMSSYKDIELGINLAISIAFHNIPEGISIAVPIYYATKSKKKAIIKTLISGLSEPLGAILAFLILSKYITNTLISITLLFVAGIMISLAIEVIFPKTKEYNLNKYLLIGLLLGIATIFINHFII